MPTSYTPIVRNRGNERLVLQRFGGLSHFDPEERDRERELRPLVEVTEVDELDNLSPFFDSGDQVFIDVPEYLLGDGTVYEEGLSELFAKHSSRYEFFHENKGRIDYPVISGLLDSRIDYGVHTANQDLLKDDFECITHRLLFHGGAQFNEWQREQLQELAKNLREEDRLLFDMVDTAPIDEIREQVRVLSELFEGNPRTLLCVFDPFEGEVNETPKLAEEFGMTGFGDFAITYRFPKGGGGGKCIIRHYDARTGSVRKFEGGSFIEASQVMIEWEDWDPDHCEFCREADRRKKGDPSTLKRLRMGHYIESMLRGET